MLRQKWVRGNREEAWIERRFQARIQEDAALTEAQKSPVPLGSSCEALTWIYFLEWRCVPPASGEDPLQVRKPDARCCAFPSLRDRGGGGGDKTGGIFVTLQETCCVTLDRAHSFSVL